MKVKFQQILERGEEMHHVAIGGKRIPGKRNRILGRL